MHRPSMRLPGAAGRNRHNGDTYDTGQTSSILQGVLGRFLSPNWVLTSYPVRALQPFFSLLEPDPSALRGWSAHFFTQAPHIESWLELEPPLCQSEMPKSRRTHVVIDLRPCRVHSRGNTGHLCRGIPGPSVFPLHVHLDSGQDPGPPLCRICCSP